MKTKMKRKIAMMFALIMLFSLVNPMSLQVKAAEGGTGTTSVFDVALNGAVEKEANRFSYSNAKVTSKNESDLVTSLTVIVNKGDIQVGDANFTDSKAQHQIATWVWPAGTSVSAVETKIKSIVFDYAQGMEVTVIVDGNKMNLPNNSKVTSYILDSIPQGSAEVEGNIHYYMYVPYGGEKQEWDNAYNTAKTYYFMGMRGYLVTITEAGEDKILNNISNAGAWAGGAKVSKSMNTFDQENFNTDLKTIANIDSVWKWVCGPEANTMINISESVAASLGIGGANTGYANWRRPDGDPDNQEPNNYNGAEYWLQVHFPDSTNGWNDLNTTTMGDSEDGKDYLSGFFVEFSEYPTGFASDYSSERKITVTNVPTHEHDWNIEASENGGSIRVYCKEDFCKDQCLTNGTTKAKTIQVTANNATYNGMPYTGTSVQGQQAVIDLLKDYPETGDTWIVATTYEGRDGTVYNRSEIAPTDAGKYNVVVALTNSNGDLYVTKKPFEIQKKNVSVRPQNQTVGQGGIIVSDPAKVTVNGLIPGDVIDSVKISGDTASITDHGTLSISNIVIKNGDKDVSANYNIQKQNGILKVVQAHHDWKAEVDDQIPGVLDVYCDNGDPTSDPGCANVGKQNAAKIELEAPNATYTGNPYTGASFDDDVIDAINSGLPANKKWTVSDITYEGREGTNYPESKIAPTNVGKYNAIVTVKDSDGNAYTVKKPFEIEKPKVTVTPKNQTVGQGGTVSSTTDMVTVTGLNPGDALTSVVIAGDTSALTENGTLTIDSIVIKHGEQDVTTNYVLDAKEGKLTVKPAEHKWKAENESTDSGIVDVYCTSGDPVKDAKCPYVGKENAAKVQLDAPNASYIGKPYEGAKIKDDGILDLINENLPENKKWTISDTTYSGREGTDYPESKTAPTNVGKYDAIVTLKDSTGHTYVMKTPFEITKQEVTVTPKKQIVAMGDPISSTPNDVEVTGLTENDAIATVVINGDTSNITKGTTMTVSGIIIKNGSQDVTNNYNIKTNDGILVVPGKHIWKVDPETENPSVLNVYCENGNPANDPGCENVGKENAAKVELEAPNAPYSGKPYDGAKLKDNDLIGVINANLPDDKKWIVSATNYEGREGTNYPESTTAPTEVGKYNAIAIVKDSDGHTYTLKTPFEITKQKVTVTPKTQIVGKGGVVSSKPEDVEAEGLGIGDVIASVKITGDTSVLTDDGKLTVVDIVIKKGNQDVTANYDVEAGEGVLKVVPGMHSWKVEADKQIPGVIDVYCEAGDPENDPGCPAAGKENAAKIAFDAPNATYTGQPYKEAKVNDPSNILDKMNADLPQDKKWTMSDISYEGREGTTYPESKTAPTDVGKYNAVVMMKDPEGKTYVIKNPFEIEKQKLTITPKDQTVLDGATVSSTPSDVVASGLTNGDNVTAITIKSNAAKDKIMASNAVIKNGEKDVTANYDITYADGKLNGKGDVPNNPTTVTFDKAGAQEQLQLPTPDKDTPVIWKSSDEKVATVDSDGKVTAVANGTATITAVDPDGNVKAQYKIVVDIPKKEATIKAPTKKEVYANETAMNAGLKVMQTKKQINVKWGKVPGANLYEVYVQYCGKKFKKKPTKTVNNAVTTSVKITKINGKKLNLKKNYKVYIVAYKVSGSQKVCLGESIRAHIVGVKNTKQTNVKAVKVKKKKFTLSVGQTAQIKAWTVLVDKTKHQLSNAHAKALRYRSDNEKIVKVSTKGKITAVGKGKCIVYVYARNGYAKKVTVTVK